MKSIETVKMTETGAAEALKALLHHIPDFKIESDTQFDLKGPDRGYDIVFEATHNERAYQFITEVKYNGQPRHIREAIWRLREYKDHSNRDFVSVIIASYLSPQSRDMCKEADIGYLDMMGNARLAFDAVYIEKSVEQTPKTEARALRSLFTPKAARILSVMMQEPGREWRVTDLAKAADVSLGHVSNVRKRLLLREWAEEREQGVSLSNPSDLLNVWRENHPRRVSKTITGYTHLHGYQLTERLEQVLSPGHDDTPLAICAGVTAAQWIAPFERSSVQSFYANESGLAGLVHGLDMSHVSKGTNVIIRVVEKDKILPGIFTANESIYCTSPLQTYLDLWKYNERSREAAEHLREAYFNW